MASLTLGTNDRLTQKEWGDKVEREVLPATCHRLMVKGNSGSSAVRLEDTLSKRAGDRIRLPYLFASDQLPIKGVKIEGNEHSPDYTDFDLLIDKQSFAERREVDLNDQRTEFKFRDDMKYLISNRWVENIEISTLNHLGGNSLGTDHAGNTGFDANNTITEPDSDYHLFSGTATAETALVAGDNLSSANIRAAATRAETLRTGGAPSGNIRPVIPRCSLEGRMAWGLLISPTQRDFLLAETGERGDFMGVQLAAMEGGEKGSDAVLRSRYVSTVYQKEGLYAGVCIYTDPYVPFGTDGGTAQNTDVDRSIFFGAGAGALGFGRMGSMSDVGKFAWVEEEFRYLEDYGIAAKSIWGFVKAGTGGASQTDLATIVISSHRS